MTLLDASSSDDDDGGSSRSDERLLTRLSLHTATQALRYMQEFVAEPWSLKTNSLQTWVGRGAGVLSMKRGGGGMEGGEGERRRQIIHHCGTLHGVHFGTDLEPQMLNNVLSREVSSFKNVLLLLLSSCCCCRCCCCYHAACRLWVCAVPRCSV